MNQKQIDDIKLKAVKNIMQDIGHQTRLDYVFNKLCKALDESNYLLMAEYYPEGENNARTANESLILDACKDWITETNQDNADEPEEVPEW